MPGPDVELSLFLAQPQFPGLAPVGTLGAVYGHERNPASPVGETLPLPQPILHQEEAGSSLALGFRVAGVLPGRQPPDAQVEAQQVTDDHKQDCGAQHAAQNPPATDRVRCH